MTDESLDWELLYRREREHHLDCAQRLALAEALAESRQRQKESLADDLGRAEEEVARLRGVHKAAEDAWAEWDWEEMSKRTMGSSLLVRVMDALGRALAGSGEGEEAGRG